MVLPKSSASKSLVDVSGKRLQLTRALMNSKFECHYKCYEVEGSVDVDLIAQKFADHFSTADSANDTSRASIMYDEYINARVNYSGFPLTLTKLYDAEILGNTIDNLSRGKAAGLDSLTSEHLQNCHPTNIDYISKII